jgi:DNA polymerase-3 subunit alpha
VLLFKQQEVRLAGMITDYSIKHNKQGRPFAIFSLEDYAGTLEIALFGEEFLKNKHMLQKGMFVYLVGVVAARYKQSDTWELRPQKISLLSEVRERLSKKLLIKLPLVAINQELTEQVQKMVTSFPGSCSFHIAIEDVQESVAVELVTGSHRISPTNEFLDRLSQIQGLSYQLISA